MEDDDADHTPCSTCGNMNHNDELECGYCGEMLTSHQVYVQKKFTSDHLSIISTANEILTEYDKDGYTLTLRQLYYQFVSQDLIENTEKSYKRLGGIINDARLAGLISFTRIEDRGRTCEVHWSQDDPYAVLNDIAYHYREDYWLEQDYYVEVWVEKDALSSVIERPCEKWRVPYMACKGYMSASAQWEAGNRFKVATGAGKECVLIHLGDHDPSGIDMTRDNHARLNMFVGSEVNIRRVALNMDQITRYNPPPNPTKVTDSRAKDYIRRYGHTSWELDALTPSVITNLIDSEIRRYVDTSLWNDVVRREETNREVLNKISDNSEAVFDFVKGL